MIMQKGLSFKRLPPFIFDFQKLHSITSANNIHTKEKQKPMQSKSPKILHLDKPISSPSLLHKSTITPLNDKKEPNIGIQS